MRAGGEAVESGGGSSVDVAAGGGCTNGIIYGSVATLNTRKRGAAP